MHIFPQKNVRSTVGKKIEAIKNESKKIEIVDIDAFTLSLFKDDRIKTGIRFWKEVKTRYDKDNPDKENPTIPWAQFQAQILASIQKMEDGFSIEIRQAIIEDTASTGARQQFLYEPGKVFEGIAKKERLPSYDRHFLRLKNVLAGKSILSLPELPSFPLPGDRQRIGSPNGEPLDLYQAFDNYKSTQIFTTRFRGMDVYQSDDWVIMNKDNIRRMRDGRMPKSLDGNPLNYHHWNQQMLDIFAEIVQDIHQQADRALHDKSKKSIIEREDYSVFRQVCIQYRELQLSMDILCKELNGRAFQIDELDALNTPKTSTARHVMTDHQAYVHQVLDMVGNARTNLGFRNIIDKIPSKQTQFELLRAYVDSFQRYEVDNFLDLKTYREIEKLVQKANSEQHLQSLMSEHYETFDTLINKPFGTESLPPEAVALRTQLQYQRLMDLHGAPSFNALKASLTSGHLPDYKPVKDFNIAAVIYDQIKGAASEADFLTELQKHYKDHAITAKARNTDTQTYIATQMANHTYSLLKEKHQASSFDQLKANSADFDPQVQQPQTPVLPAPKPEIQLTPVNVAQLALSDSQKAALDKLPDPVVAKKMQAALEMLRNQYHLTLLVDTILTSIRANPADINLCLMADAALTMAIQNCSEIESFVKDLRTNNLMGTYQIAHPGLATAEFQQHLAMIKGVDSVPTRIEGLDLSQFDEWHLVHELKNGGAMSDIEIDEILTDLVRGIYLYDAYPFFSMEPGLPGMATPVLHPAYRNTKVGSLLLELDYYLKTSAMDQYVSVDKLEDFFKNYTQSVNDDRFEFKNKFGFMHYEGMDQPFTTLDNRSVTTHTVNDIQQFVQNQIFNQLQSDRFHSVVQITGAVNGVEQHGNTLKINPPVYQYIKDIGNDQIVKLAQSKDGPQLLSMMIAIMNYKLDLIPGLADKFSQFKLVTALTTFLAEAKAQGKIPILNHLSQSEPIHTPAQIPLTPQLNSENRIIFSGGCGLEIKPVTVQPKSEWSTGTQIAADYLNTTDEHSGIYQDPDGAETQLCLRLKLQPLTPASLSSFLPPVIPNRELLDSFVTGDETRVRSMIRKHPEQIWQFDEKGASALHYAVRHDMPNALADIVVLHGPVFVPDVYQKMPLDEAVDQKKFNLGTVLLKGKETPEKRQLLSVIAQGVNVLTGITWQDNQTLQGQTYRTYSPSNRRGLQSLLQVLTAKVPGENSPTVTHALKTAVTCIRKCLDNQLLLEDAVVIEQEAINHLGNLITYLSESTGLPETLTQNYALKIKEEQLLMAQKSPQPKLTPTQQFVQQNKGYSTSRQAIDPNVQRLNNFLFTERMTRLANGNLKFAVK